MIVNITKPFKPYSLNVRGDTIAGLGMPSLLIFLNEQTGIDFNSYFVQHIFS